MKALVRKLTPYLPASYKTLSRNFLYITFYRGVITLTGIATMYFLARSLTKDEFGSYQFILNVVGMCWIFALPGMQNAIMQDTSREQGASYRKASDLAFLTSLFGSFTLLGFSEFYRFTHQPQLSQAFLLAGLIFPFFKGLQHWRGVLLGHENIFGLYLNEGLTNLIMAGTMIVTVLLLPGSLLAPLAVVLAVPALQNLLMSVWERSRIKGRAFGHDYIKYGYKTSSHLAAVIISQHLDKILIFTFLSPAALAIYVAGARFADIARDAMQDIVTIITPRLARISKYTDRLDSIFRFTAIAYGLFLTLISFTILPWLIILIFGESYRESIVYAQALMIANALGTYATFQYRYVRSQLDEKAHKETALYLALTQIVFSVALIPLFGLKGVIVSAYLNKIALMIYIRRIIKQKKSVACMTQPLITIGMTCFNAADTIARAIDSALAQDRDDCEIVIVDDGSRDDSVAVITEKIKPYPQARLIVHPENKGFPGTLNTVIDAARGEFLIIFDDDDVSVPHRVNTQYQRLTAYEREFGTDLVICHAARTQVFPNDYRRYEPTMGTASGIAPHGEAVAERILIGKLSPHVVGACANCSRMARVSLFKKLGGYDARLRRAEDVDFNIRLSLAGGHFAGVAEPLVVQTMVLSSDKTLDEEYAGSLRLLDKHRPYLESKGWNGFCRAWLDIRFAHLRGEYGALALKIMQLMARHPLKVAQKLLWTIPAYRTRRDIKKWHHAAFNG